ncbi:hypothetical protein BpHYR1_008445 [Brachionus plicatilis]|uniref:Uncharacterized protein n=1 Tax=Brachionus plicatilis TaxID=10195 RepID=A0A3M7PUH0_BRAPC|nr:hypothetical protein BpHYR1_008445 [Brachionus plicatilis]
MVSIGTIPYRIPDKFQKNSIFKKGKQTVHHITNSKSTVIKKAKVNNDKININICYEMVMNLQIYLFKQFQTKLHKIWTKFRKKLIAVTNG